MPAFIRNLAALVVVAVCVGAPAALAAPTAGSGAGASSLESQVVREMNAVRTSRGLAPLRLSPQLAAAANAHSRDMARRGYFDHTSADGTSFGKRVERFYRPGNHSFYSVGENLLWYSPDVDARTTVSMWMKSPGHRANLLTPYWREVGLSALHVAAAPGTFKGLEVTIVTADFGVRR